LTRALAAVIFYESETTMANPTPGIYRHFKGDEYEVIGTFVHTETGEEFIAYQATSPPYQRYVRPKAMFIDNVDRPMIGYSGPRYRLIAPR
jgi:hypothetical protein